MTDIVEQAARVLCEANGGNPDYTPKSYVNGIATGEVNDPLWVDYIDEAQALADAGLLAEPARTVPTREQIARALSTHHYSIAYGGCACGADFEDETETLEAEQEAYNQHAADEVLELLAGQPTVAEVKAQALEGAADLTDNPHEDYWLRERARQIRGGE